MYICMRISVCTYTGNEFDSDQNMDEKFNTYTDGDTETDMDTDLRY
jgi:hypothetical protein